MDAEYIGTRQSEATTIESCDQEESCVTDVQTSDGEMYYGVFSDDESSESNEVDYETDLEVDEESMFKLCGNVTMLLLALPVPKEFISVDLMVLRHAFFTNLSAT